ncbi:c-type cytochrome [Nitrosophilus labii]|uniref:c-type cytochrome n=1 Tax=Nitrosophilus labii TaxID=2706014 RepID=UPI001656DB78|nr:c-type cytochrome [Nitrosophilus labii]
MKKTFVCVALMSSALLFASQNYDGKKLFEEKCMSCHIATIPTIKQKRSMVAPPIMGVMFHVKENYSNKEDAVNFIIDYVMNPSLKKAVCMPGSIRRFGLMPSMKDTVTKDELKAIAKYIYDNYPPKGFMHPNMNKQATKNSSNNNCNVKSNTNQ